MTLNFESLLSQVLQVAVEVTFHLRVLCLEKGYMLVTRLIVIIKVAYARLLLIFDYLFTQNFKLKLHEVDLLLQIDDVIVHGVHVGVGSQLAWILLLFFLSSEVHRHRRIISTAVAEGASSRKIASFLQSTATFTPNSN